MTGDEAIHAAHCSPYSCLYGDPNCPVFVEALPGGKAESALAGLAADLVDEGTLAEEYAVRNTASGWVYALPKVLPKFLDGKRGTEECARWHLRQIAGPDEGDWTGFEIVKRPVGAWEVVG